jgi:integrase
MKRQRRGKKGEVHLFQPNGSASWWVRYTANGKRHRRNTGKADEGEARIFAANVARMVGLANSDNLDEKRRLLEIIRELVREIPELESEAAHVTPTKHLPTAREWFKRELDAMRQNSSGDDRHVKAVSVTRVEQVVDDFLDYLKAQAVNLADAPLSRIGPDDVGGFLSDYKAKGYSGASRKFALARIRAVFGHAMDKGLLPMNPASIKQVGRLKFDSASIRQPFNTGQIAAVMDAAAQSSEKWLSLCAMLGLFTGQRAGDICAMRWDDVRDFDGTLPTIHLRQQKTGNAVVIPIADPLRRVLKAVPKADRKGYLLPEKIAAAYHEGRRRNFIRAWRGLLNGVDLAALVEVPTLAKVERNGTHGRTRYAWSFHSFRHTCATHLSGPDAHYLLGHRSEDEKRLGQTAQYRHEDLQRLKKQLDGIPYTSPTNMVQMKEVANA